MTVHELYKQLNVLNAYAPHQEVYVTGLDEKGDRVTIRLFGGYIADRDNSGRPIIVLK